jgi:hypothetical protein
VDIEFISWMLRQIFVYVSFVCFALGFIKAGWKVDGKNFVPDWKSAGMFFFLIAWTVLA